MRTALLIACLLSASLSFAQNPLNLGSDIKTADPSGHVWADGKMYLYTSHDQECQEDFTMKDWHTFSSADLVHWTDHGVSLSVDKLAWADNYAWAPDAAYKNGKYYLIFPAGTGTKDRVNPEKSTKWMGLGVAVSDSPTGPFVDAIGGPLWKTPYANDPSLFIDDDGSSYVYFHGSHADYSVAELADDLLSVKDGLTKMDMGGYEPKAEGPWVFKRNGIYYFTMAEGNRTLTYYMGSSPKGPWTYKGTIMAKEGESNNHHSIVAFKGQWILFYHRWLHNAGSNCPRAQWQVAAEYLHFNSDDTIQEVQRTAVGVGPGGSPPPARYSQLQGVVMTSLGPMTGATVWARDTKGATARTRTDASGHYQLDTSGWTAPIAVAAHEAGNDNCLRNDQPRARCMVAIRTTHSVGTNITNVNALTDWVASNIALARGYRGPQQLAQADKLPAISAQHYAQALDQFHAGFGQALADAGVPTSATYDPTTATMQSDTPGMNAVLRVLNHTRAYDNNTGEASATVLTDPLWQPVTGPFGPHSNPPLQLAAAEAALHDIQHARLRIFVVSDSTAASYERQRRPRMGWGQVFGDYWKPLGDGSRAVAVVNGARAGRSSRDFFNGGWYGQMLPYLRPGDYVLIAHGHNDQNCNAQKPLRGAADVANLCTYPNDAQGKRQFPVGHPELSFATSLERYVQDARACGAIPILLTPTTRYLNTDRMPAYTAGDTRPVVSQHLTRQNASGGYAFTGNYSQTVRDTAAALQVPLIDLETKTITFANQHADDWQNYWLVVKDMERYPWYATQTEGVAAKPDTTHFQEAGARAVADLVAQGLRESPALKPLAAWLK